MSNFDTLPSVGGYNLEGNILPDFDSSVFNIFNRTQPRSEIEGKFTEILKPERKITADTQVINYAMVPQRKRFTYLDTIYLLGKIKLQKKIGRDGEWEGITENDPVSVVNNVIPSLFAKIIIRLNDTEISDPTTDPYPWTSFIATLFNTTAEFKKYLEAQLYFPDDSGQHNIFNIKQNQYECTFDASAYTDTNFNLWTGTIRQDPTTKLLDKPTPEQRKLFKKMDNMKLTLKPSPDPINTAFIKRRAPLLNGKSFSFRRRIDHDIVTSLTVLPPGTKISFQFTKKHQDFAILTSDINPDNAYRVLLEDLNLELTLVEVVDSVKQAYMRKLNSSSIPPKIDFTRNFIKTYPVLSNHTHDFGYPNFIISNTLPETLIIGFVKQDAFLGSKNKNPYCFEKIAFTQANIIVNGRIEPEIPFETTTDEGLRRLYYHLQESCGENQQNSQFLDLTLEQFLNGSYFLYFDRSKAKDNRATKTIPDVGNLSIVLRASTDAKVNKFVGKEENWMVVCFCVYQSAINFYGEHVEITQFV